MTHILLYIIGIIVVIVTLGYVGLNQSISPSLQQYVPAQIQQRFPTGDIMTLALQALPNSKTQTFGTLPQNTITTSNNPTSTPTTSSATTPQTTLTSGQTNPINTSPQHVNVTQSSIISVQAGQSFGQTQQFKQVMPTDTYQLGNPVHISGTIQMVIPNSCINVNGQVTCQYVQPPIWHYLVVISCKIPENNNCAMDDATTYGITDGAGNFNWQWIPSTDQNAGLYLVTIQASSQVKDPQGQEYVLTQQKMANMVK